MAEHGHRAAAAAPEHAPEDSQDNAAKDDSEQEGEKNPNLINQSLICTGIYKSSVDSTSPPSSSDAGEGARGKGDGESTGRLEIGPGRRSQL